jgi:flagellar protein FlgJ
MSDAIGAAGTTPPALDPAKDAKLRKACAQLEAVFMNELAKALRETVPQEGVLDSSAGGDMFASMFDERLAEIAAARTQSGVSAALYRQLSGQP